MILKLGSAPKNFMAQQEKYFEQLLNCHLRIQLL